MHTPHTHPMPALTKVSLNVKEKYEACVTTAGCVGATVSKVDHSNSTRLLLDGKTPAMFSPALQNQRVKRNLDSGSLLYLDGQKKPLDERYIHCCRTTDDGGLLVLTGVPFLIKLLDDPGVRAFDDDTTFKRVKGEMNEWELALYLKEPTHTSSLRRIAEAAGSCAQEILVSECGACQPHVDESKSNWENPADGGKRGYPARGVTRAQRNLWLGSFAEEVEDRNGARRGEVPETFDWKKVLVMGLCGPSLGMWYTPNVHAHVLMRALGLQGAKREEDMELMRTPCAESLWSKVVGLMSSKLLGTIWQSVQKFPRARSRGWRSVWRCLKAAGAAGFTFSCAHRREITIAPGNEMIPVRLHQGVLNDLARLIWELGRPRERRGIPRGGCHESRRPETPLAKSHHCIDLE
ncbi:hypothetical protein B0H13DRAFT_1923462 [Mycena leptocephala]|nr:hypothetical protein B0H13DRAFT_1923462 [Mycena leptocephala]